MVLLHILGLLACSDTVEDVVAAEQSADIESLTAFAKGRDPELVAEATRSLVRVRGFDAAVETALSSRSDVPECIALPSIDRCRSAAAAVNALVKECRQDGVTAGLVQRFLGPATPAQARQALVEGMLGTCPAELRTNIALAAPTLGDVFPDAEDRRAVVRTYLKAGLPSDVARALVRMALTAAQDGWDARPADALEERLAEDVALIATLPPDARTTDACFYASYLSHLAGQVESNLPNLAPFAVTAGVLECASGTAQLAKSMSAHARRITTGLKKRESLSEALAHLSALAAAARASFRDERFSTLATSLEQLVDAGGKLSEMQSALSGVEGGEDGLRAELERLQADRRAYQYLRGYVVAQVGPRQYEVQTGEGRALLETFATTYDSRGSFSLWVVRSIPQVVTVRGGFEQEWPTYEEAGREQVQRLDRDILDVKSTLARERRRRRPAVEKLRTFEAGLRTETSRWTRAFISALGAQVTAAD
ncbi:MAG: hypothetical protein H6716_25235 [Polyangiaceae bacterium]|nr:hypothetical protein [Polyangiaceae bacterium]